MSIVSIVVVLGFAEKSQKNQIFNTNNLKININYDNDNRFVNFEDIKDEITYLNSSGTKYFNQLNVLEIEKRISNNPSISDAQVFKSIDGKLFIDVTQRTPIARIFSQNESYYIDDNGQLMPLSSKYTSRTLVFNGFINEPYSTRYRLNITQLSDTLAKKTLLDDIFILADYINKSDFWSAQIEQVFVNKEMDFELIPKVGNHKIVLGGVDNLSAKFNKLMVFYKKALPHTGWNEYSVVNLNYKNQIVCTKNYN